MYDVRYSVSVVTPFACALQLAVVLPLLSYQHIAAQLNNEAAEDLVSKYADLCQEQDRLLHYIGFLNQRQQDVIRRYYFEQQPWGEIADGMGSTPKTVQRLRQQAVEELANLYAFADGILRR